MSRVIAEIVDAVAQIRLAWGRKINAVHQAIIDGLIAAAAQVSTVHARAAVLSGEGEAIFAGIDIGDSSGLLGQDMQAIVMPRTNGDGTTNQWHEMAMVLHWLETPVIAALHDAVDGTGLQPALGADIRIAHPASSPAVKGMKWRLLPDMGASCSCRVRRGEVPRRLI